MSPHLPPSQPAPRPLRPRSRPRAGCATVLIAVCGFILLLPGICTILFGLSLASDGMLSWGDIPSLVPIVLVTGLVFALGIDLIRRVFR